MPWWPAALVTAIFVAPLVAVSQFVAHLNDAILDDHLFGYYGWRLAEGATLYRDIWDNKPPGTFWINALGFRLSGGSYGGVIILCLLAQLMTLACIFAAANKIYRRSAASLITILAAVYLTHSSFFGGGNRNETYLIVFETGLVALYLAGWRRDQGWCWYAAGFCGGMALLMKQNGCAALLAAFIHLAGLTLTGNLARGLGIRRAIQIAGGCAGVILVSGCILASQGVLMEAWRAIVTANRVYLAIEPVGIGHVAWWWVRLERSELPLLKLPLMLALGSLAQAMAKHGSFRNAADEIAPAKQGCPWPLMFLGTWMLLGIIGAAIGPLPSSHYVLPVLPAMLLFGGAFIDAIVLETGLTDTLRRRASRLLLLLIALYFGGDPVLEQLSKASVVYWMRQPRIVSGRLVVKPTAMEELGAEIRQRTKPDQLIQCWDYLPGVCLAARRATRSRFPDHLRAEWAAKAGIASPNEFAEAIRSAPPALVVMGSSSHRELAHLAVNGPSGTREAAQFIIDHYQLSPKLTRENVVVLRLRESRERG